MRLRNAGTQAVSYLKFTVKIDGQEVPTYMKQMCVVNIDPGTADEVELFNFYSSSMVKSFDVEVTLVEAQWVQVQKTGATTTTTPPGPVTELLTRASLYVRMSPGN